MPHRVIDLDNGGWWLRHAPLLKTLFRVMFGIIWLIDGLLKFQPGFVDGFPDVIAGAGENAPPWLQGWYSFWVDQANAHAAFWVYSTGALELALGFSLIFGFARKLAYFGGVILSLLIWTVPEGFGGGYGPGTTDPGVGIVYAMFFLGLIVINSVFGPSRLSLDYYIERRFPKWAWIAEMDSKQYLEQTPAATAPTA
jgi:thiosulfate dehydrogenase (quinone) large subunit